MKTEDREMAADLALVDLSDPETSVGGQVMVVDKLVEHIREALPKSLTQLRRAVNDGNHEKVGRLARALKSPMGTLGAEKAFRMAREMELRAVSGDMSLSLAILADLESEIEIIIDFFANPEWRGWV